MGSDIIMPNDDTVVLKAKKVIIQSESGKNILICDTEIPSISIIADSYFFNDKAGKKEFFSADSNITRLIGNDNLNLEANHGIGMHIKKDKTGMSILENELEFRANNVTLGPSDRSIAAPVAFSPEIGEKKILSINPSAGDNKFDDVKITGKVQVTGQLYVNNHEVVLEQNIVDEIDQIKKAQEEMKNNIKNMSKRLLKLAGPK